MNAGVEDTTKPLFEPLTRREQEILEMLAEGLTSREMAERLTLAVSSVRWYIQQIYSKLGVNGKRQAVVRADELGLLRQRSSNLAATAGFTTPALRARQPCRNNLPLQLTSFIGREVEIVALRQLITAGPARLVTLTGSGGVGKTRLALHTAEEVLDDFTDGVWLVELAPLADPGLVAQAAASTLGLPQQSGQTVTQVLCEHLQPKHLLLVLDNCEHVVSAAAELANTLLRACPRVYILATSREILGVDGETAFRCPSLSLPDPQHLAPAAELVQSDAVHLFVERAQANMPGFSLTEANSVFVARICMRLDGIPLAIELAAARVRLLSLEQIASRLEADFRLLTGGSRTALPRHQTLNALIDWSYRLLSEKERRLLLRLSVFAGGWTLEAAEAVCCDQGEGCLAGEEILDLLGQLVDKSLVFMPADASGEQPRYRMLETIRQYAHAKLVSDPSIAEGETAAVRQRHLDYIFWLALQAKPHLRGKNQWLWLDRMDLELDNIRLASDWALENDIQKGLQLATALEWFWHLRNHSREGIDWLERLLAAEAAAGIGMAMSGNQSRSLGRSIARGKALNSLGKMKINWVGGENVVPLLEEARAIFEEQGDLYQIDLAISQGLLAQTEVDLDRAVAGINQASDLLRKAGDDFLVIDNLDVMVRLNINRGDLAQARSNAEECLARSRKIDDVDDEAFSLALLGILELISGTSYQAALFLGEAQSCFDIVGNQIFSTLIVGTQALVAMSAGNYLKATQLNEAYLALSIKMNDKGLMLDAMTSLGWADWALKDYDQSIRQCDESLALARELQPVVGIMTEYMANAAIYILGRVALSRGNYSLAYDYLKTVLLAFDVEKNSSWKNFIWIPFGFTAAMQYFTFLAIHALGILASTQHQHQRAATLFGVQAEVYARQKNTLSLAEREEYEQALASTRAALGEEVLAAAWEKGRAMTLQQAVGYAVEAQD
jgi:predicted ATPase/DNA-binding CsgD family transcriptional regulator